MTCVLRDSTFKEMRDFIYDKSGIFIPDSKKYLIENRLVRRVQDNRLNSFEDYLFLVKCGDNCELTKLFDAITTNETYFFREPQQLDVLVDCIVPRLTSEQTLKEIRIWSAACSTGEEPYTVAMMLMEKATSLRRYIISSDISDGVLESAARAMYNAYSVRNVSEHYMKKYFVSRDQNHELSAVVKSSVRFMNINLMDERKMRSVRGMDIILCRNVLIYFDEKAKQKVASLLYNSLKPGGYLVIGSSESLHNVTRAFKPVIMNKVVLYQRVE